jgi:hypothetical protein
MSVLPSFYIDNVALSATETINVRGNQVTDLQGSGSVRAFNISNCENLRVKNNKALRIRSVTNNGIGFYISNCPDTLLVYNVASRCDVGFDFSSITTLNVYNLTAHNCTIGIRTFSNGTFRNIALSTVKGSKYYQTNTGFLIETGDTADIDYMYYDKLGTLINGTATQGDNIWENQILYMDEANDDLTPDYITVLVNTGTANPLRTTTPCIGGIESEIVDEVTANRKYHYELLDNSFWDIDNQEAAEVAIIKAFQSRILANAEAAEQTVERNNYVKFATSVLRFSDLFPMQSYYANQTKFRNRVMDMWYSTQNVGTKPAINNAIGGYNLFPTFFQRASEIEDGWIIDVSYVNDNNWLLGDYDLKYGIVIDVLGTSTLSKASSGECYTNVMNSVADIAPTRWALHDEPEPTNYILFTDMYRGFENCVLDNMIYDDDFAISPDIENQDGEIVTPMILTAAVATTGAAASGNYELSTLDRVYSDNITRTMYYKLGDTAAEIAAESWTEITYPIGEIINLNKSYIQFRIVIEDILRRIDYAFLGLCLRPYTTSLIWDWSERPTS